MKLTITPETVAYKKPFKIAYAVRTELPIVHIALSEGEHTGVGEAIGVSYLGEDQASVLRDLEGVFAAVEAGVDRATLQDLLPAGGARNGLDCALWDLECKRSGKTIWQLTGIAPQPVQSVYTVSVDDPDIMAAEAATGPSTHLKIKLDATTPVERVAAVRKARPDATLIIDANQSWTLKLLTEVAPELARLGVEMIEQPLPRGEDAPLEGYVGPIPIGADESCQTVEELDGLPSGYSVINIKLDKTGGLTGALALAQAGKAKGYQLMVGCMAGTSLSMAPAFVVAQLCRFVDIDGPLLHATDRAHPMVYTRGRVSVPDRALWG
jgi:L-alanine-DL-glutamate epimerase-like enolase superfamily enzyme